MTKAVATTTLALCFIAALCAPARAQQADTPLLQIPYAPALDVNSMDKTVDPCVDFYKYSCGGWMKHNPIPADQASWDVYSKLAQDNQRLLWGIAQSDSTMQNRTPVQQKVGDYFSACMDTSKVDALGIKPMQPWLTRIDSIKDVRGLSEFFAALQQAGIGIPFSAGSTQDYGNAERVIIGIEGGGLGLPDRDYYTKTDDKSKKIRDQYQAYIAQMLGFAGEDPKQATADAAAILAMETKLAEASLTRVERREPHNLYHIYTMDQLKQDSPSINWAELFRSVGVSPKAGINVSQPKFLKAMSEEMRSEQIALWRAYLRFHLMTYAAGYLATPIQTAQFDFYMKTLRGVEQQPPRWKKCVREEDRFLGEALGQEFVRVAFSQQAKADTVRMTDQIEQAMAVRIKNLDWMSEETKQQALTKLHGIRNKIGYPNKWRDYSTLEIRPGDYFGNVMRAIEFENKRDFAKIGKPLDRDEWGMTPPTVNAYFNPQMSDINFPAGVLQPPLYDVKSDAAPNYGDTGGTIGHELTHGFDDEGRQFDAKGNLRDWWTKDDAAKFQQKVECIQDQYATYTVIDDVKINSKLTSGEDIADLGGELLAYMAWQVETGTTKLADADDLTPARRFFVGFAQWACENDRPEELRMRAMTDPHSPAAARINGVVVNMPEFRQAFGCKVGQPMAPAKMCSVW